MKPTSPQHRKLLKEMDYKKRKQEKEEQLTGGLQNQTRNLQNKLRTGEITQQQLQILSLLNYEPAQQLTKTKPPTNIEEWIKGLAKYGERYVVIVSVNAAELALPIFKTKHPNDSSPIRAVNAIRKWLSNPSNAMYLELISVEGAVWDFIFNNSNVSSAWEAAFVIKTAANTAIEHNARVLNAIKTIDNSIRIGISEQGIKDRARNEIIKEILG